jgi:hypothetical protein
VKNVKRALICLACLAAAALGALHMGCSEPKGTPFRLIYAAETIGYLTPKEGRKNGTWRGGFDRRSTAIKDARTAPRSFVVDCGGFVGDFRFGTEPYRDALGRFVLKGMDATGVELCNVDHTDQQWGKERLLEYASLVSFPFISASILDAETGEYLFEPFKIIERDGLSVAFVGVLDRSPIEERQDNVDYARQRLPGDMDIPQYEHMPGTGEGLRVLPVDEAIEKVAPMIKGKADVVVLLGSGAAKLYRAMRQYGDGKTFNLVLSVTGKPSEEPMVQGKVPVYMTGLAGAFLGVVDCEYMGPGDVKVTRWDPVSLDRSIKSDPTLVDLPRQMRKSLADIDPTLLAEKIYEPKPGEKYVGAEVCATCHKQEYEIWKSGPHYHALESLKKQDAQYDPKCLECHVGDYQAVDGYISEEKTPMMAPITCEFCHGRGNIHVEQRGVGPNAKLLLPDAPRCRICHDYINDPNFDFDVDWGIIQHGKGLTPTPVPEGAGYSKKASEVK